MTNSYLSHPKRLPEFILIQDLHCHREAQEHIAGIITHLYRKLDIDTVFVEGAFARVDVSIIRTLPKRVRDPLIDRLLREGYLSGAELAAISLRQSWFNYSNLSPLQMLGLETPAVYAEQLQTYKRTKDLERSALQELQAIRSLQIEMRMSDDHPLAQQLKRTSRLLRLSLTPQDYDAYLQAKAATPSSPALKKAIPQAEAFYALAKKRDHILLDEAKKGAMTGPRVLVIGGFHSLGMAEQLRQEQKSFVIVTPTIHRFGYEHVYAERMNELIHAQAFAALRPLIESGLLYWNHFRAWFRREILKGSDREALIPGILLFGLVMGWIIRFVISKWGSGGRPTQGTKGDSPQSPGPRNSLGEWQEVLQEKDEPMRPESKKRTTDEGGASWFANLIYLKYVAWLETPLVFFGSMLLEWARAPLYHSLSTSWWTPLAYAFFFWAPHIIRAIQERNWRVLTSWDVLKVTTSTALVAGLLPIYGLLHPITLLAIGALTLWHVDVNNKLARSLVRRIQVRPPQNIHPATTLTRRQLLKGFVGLGGATLLASFGKKPTTPVTAPTQKRDPVYDAVVQALAHVLYFIEQKQWVKSPDTPEIIQLLHDLVSGQGTYRIQIVPDLGSLTAKVDDPPSNQLLISRVRFEKLSPREAEPILTHEIVHFLRKQRHRTQTSIDLARIVPKDFDSVLRSAQYRRDFKRSFGLDVQNEVEAYLYEFEYRKAHARSLGFQSVREYLSNLSQTTPFPDLAARYNSLLDLTEGEPGQEGLRTDPLRQGILVTQFLNPNPAMGRLLAEIAAVEGINARDWNAFLGWTLTWLKDPDYYKPASIGGAVRPQNVDLLAGLFYTRRNSTENPSQNQSKTENTFSPESTMQSLIRALRSKVGEINRKFRESSNGKKWGPIVLMLQGVFGVVMVIWLTLQFIVSTRLFDKKIDRTASLSVKIAEERDRKSPVLTNKIIGKESMDNKAPVESASRPVFDPPMRPLPSSPEDQQRQEIFEEFDLNLRSLDPKVREKALNDLARIMSNLHISFGLFPTPDLKRDIADRLADALSDEDENVRVAGAKVLNQLGKIDSQKLLDQIANQLLTESNEQARREYASELVSYPQYVLALVETVPQDSDASVRLHFLIALNNQKHYDSMLWALNDPDPAVRSTTLDLLRANAPGLLRNPGVFDSDQGSHGSNSNRVSYNSSQKRYRVQWSGFVNILFIAFLPLFLGAAPGSEPLSIIARSLWLAILGLASGVFIYQRGLAQKVSNFLIQSAIQYQSFGQNRIQFLLRSV